MISLTGSTKRFSFPILYPLSRRVKLYVAAMLSLVVFLMLLLLEPFGEIVHGFSLEGILRISSYAIVTGVSILFCELLLAPRFKWNPECHWFQTPLWYGFEILVVSTLMFLCKNAWLGFESFSVEGYLLVLQRTLSIAIFPLILIFLFLRTQRGKSAHTIFLTGENQKDSLALTTEELFFLKSEDNYTLVTYQREGRLKQKLLRGSLSRFEQQVTFPLLRIHRSVIVNLAIVKSTEGNTQGYLLTISQTEEKLKVSRKYLAAFDTAWTQYNS